MKHLKLIPLLAIATLTQACTCLPMVDKVSAHMLGQKPEPGGKSGHPSVEVAYTDRDSGAAQRPSRRTGVITPQYTNSYTPPSYASGAGSTGSIACLVGPGSISPYPPVFWYRNGNLVGRIPTTESGLSRGVHLVRFYNSGDGKWFPATPIPVDLSTAGRKATIYVKVRP